MTPDSFADGGRHAGTGPAVERDLSLAEEGADLVDVGGESTRPGAEPVPVEAELARVVPVVRELVRAEVAVSVDTLHAAVARATIEAGACMVNDVSGGPADPAMATVVAAAGVPYVAMHRRAPSREMDRHSDYGDVVRGLCGRRLGGRPPNLGVRRPSCGVSNECAARVSSSSKRVC
ncbi:dihydropteroate synthase [Streptomyces sp. NPDC050548]|uniref:dihydropteroate synthase n=1 Tax=Streptomyces sp. NPDC050548 TaxID=3365629 RepID=UPI0037A2D893